MFDKNESIKFWDDVAEEWRERAYAKDNNYSVFPSAEVRNSVLVKNLKDRFSPADSILDVGCADGELIIELKRAGFQNLHGIDNAHEMINVSNARYAEEFGDKDSGVRFTIADADSLEPNDTYDVITAIGLIEYLEDRPGFFKQIHKQMTPNGTAFIESRNRLFNVFSANEYTKRTEDLDKLIDEVNHFRQTTDAIEFQNAIADCIMELGKDIPDLTRKVEEKNFKSYPFDLPQFTPRELEAQLNEAGFIVKDFHFYHAHLFPPLFGQTVPHLYNNIGVKMQSLATTGIGALICSAFIAEVIKA